MATGNETPKHDTTEPPNDLAFDSTIIVFEQAREGSLAARRELLIRTMDPLRRWARGLLPRFARADANTDDIVQDVVLRALKALPRFEYNTAGAVLAYLRTSVRNRIADEIRKVARRGVGLELVEVADDDAVSPLEELILRERSERYVTALRTMRPNDRLLLILRLEQRLSFDEIARRLRKSTPSSARIAFGRALKKLGKQLEVEFSSAVKR